MHKSRKYDNIPAYSVEYDGSIASAVGHDIEAGCYHSSDSSSFPFFECSSFWMSRGWKGSDCRGREMEGLGGRFEEDWFMMMILMNLMLSVM